MSQIRLALLGASRISHRIVDAAKHSQRVMISAFATRSVDRVALLQKQIPKAVALCSESAYNDLLSRNDVDAVYISIPNSLHFEWAMKALKSGKHVLLEKPAVFQISDLSELVLQAKRSDRMVMEAMWYRYHSQTRFLREYLNSNAFGDLMAATSSFCFQSSNPNDIRWNSVLGGGAIRDLFCYHADLITYILQLKPADIIQVEAFARYRNEVPASVHAELKTAKGAVLNFIVSIERCSPNLSSFIGQNSSCLVSQLRVPPEIASTSIQIIGRENMNKTFSQEDAYASMLDAFARGIVGERTDLVSLSESQDNLVLMKKIEKACQIEMSDRTALIPKISSKLGRIRQKLLGT